MALNTSKCNRLTPLRFEGLSDKHRTHHGLLSVVVDRENDDNNNNIDHINHYNVPDHLTIRLRSDVDRASWRQLSRCPPRLVSDDAVSVSVGLRQ